MEELAAGLSRTERFTVDRPRTIDFMGEECRVYATPELVRDVEMCARALILEHIAEGQDSVGTRVAIEHLAATPLGMAVEITVRIREVEGRRVRLEVEGRDALDAIVRGSHERFVVDVERTAERLRAKRDRAGSG